MSGIGPISNYDSWRLASPDDESDEDVNEPDERDRFYDRSDELYQRKKEGD